MTELHLNTQIHVVIEGLFADWPPDPLALGLCLLRMDEAAPIFRADLQRAADGLCTSEGEAERLFVGLHALGGARDSLSFQPLLRLLRRPEEELERLLGDAATITLPRIVAGTFDGDAEALCAAILDPCISDHIRFDLFGTLAFLTWDGRIDRDTTIRFLERFDTEKLGGDAEFVWSGWANAILLLRLRDFLPRVERAWSEGRMDETFETRDEWLRLFERADDEAELEQCFVAGGYGYIGDVYEELTQFSGASDDLLADDSDLDRWALGIPSPAESPWRDVGRNDPCPCGSGKKFKKCCLGKEAE